jgi:ATP-dependent Clp protease protease subunit
MAILIDIHIKIILFLCSFPWILEILILIENENFDTIKMFTLLNIIIKRKFSDFIKYDFMKKKYFFTLFFTIFSFFSHKKKTKNSGNPREMQVEAEEMFELRNTIAEIYGQNTGQPINVIQNDLERDTFMSTTEAQDYAIIDHIAIEKNP